jgi:hypothetical protein
MGYCAIIMSKAIYVKSGDALSMLLHYEPYLLHDH